MARHRRSPSPDQYRLGYLMVLIALVFVVALIYYLTGDDNGEAAPPETTTTTSTPDTTEPDEEAGPSTTLPEEEEEELAPLEGYEAMLVAEDIPQPVDLTAPQGDDRLFVVQRAGVVLALDEEGQVLEEPYLDIRERVLAVGIEQGLLGMAFHPDYAENGRFFVYYIAQGGSRRLSEFAVSDNPDRADPASEIVHFDFAHPPNAVEPRHYGGQVAFDPDGYLWVGSGDGADSRRQGQDPSTPFATVMRLDVDSGEDGDRYVIPDDNPFASGGGMPEVWAYGLRNPWRFSFDPVDRLIYIADVGQNTREEINVVPFDDGGGYNFGWSDMEGDRCFSVNPCDPDNYTSPVLVYIHPDGRSITGGFVYRGEEIPELDGHYFYGDWVDRWIRSFRFIDGEVTEEHDWSDDLGITIGQVTSFGIDGHGELYFLTWDGNVYKLTAVRARDDPDER